MDYKLIYKPSTVLEAITLTINVTGFERTHLPRTQQEDTFHHHTVAVHTS